MRRLFAFCLSGCATALLLAAARADTFQLLDGQTLSGDVVSFTEKGLVVRLADGKYSDRVSWTNFSQADLKKLSGNPKIAPLAEPFIEIPVEEKVKQKTEIKINDWPRLQRPPPRSFLGAFAASGIGITLLFLLYAANIYAAFEVSVVRAYPAALVCGLAAIPVLGLASTVVFLCLPTRMKTHQQEEAEMLAARQAEDLVAATAEAEAAAQQQASGLAVSKAQAEAAPAIPQTQVFTRAMFTFNRRFFETKFAEFFASIRREAERDLELVVKTGRRQLIVQRISRIASNDIHFMVQEGPVAKEVAVQFIEIQEVLLKHKDA
jgi:hypothetical protein